MKFDEMLLGSSTSPLAITPPDFMTPREKEQSKDTDQVLVAGTVFFEVKISEHAPILDHSQFDVFDVEDLPKMAEQISAQLNASKASMSIRIGEDILSSEEERPPFFEQYGWIDLFETLIAVEYSGTEEDINLEESFCIKDVDIKVSVYKLYGEHDSIDDDIHNHRGLLGAGVHKLPNEAFEGKWEELIFDQDLPNTLLWQVSNLLKFSTSPNPTTLSPLLLLYGPPGTGKTTLCHTLAQKVSIRLNATFPTTILIELRASALLSRYYSESAKQIDSLFLTITNLSLSSPSHVFFVLIDEVESIAGSRTRGMDSGESGDTLRATNALLTGFDGLNGKCKNVFILCTSNMVDALDPAFLDRCGVSQYVGPPSFSSQYTILRNEIHDLLDRKIIALNDNKQAEDEEIIPPFYEATLFSQAEDPDYIGGKLLKIVKALEKKNDDEKTVGGNKKGGVVSGRYLSQLPEQVAMKRMRGRTYYLDDVLRDMYKEVLEKKGR